MRCEYFLICLVLGVSLAQLGAVGAEKSVIVVARSAGAPAAAHKPKTTAAPLHTSSPRPAVAEEQSTPAPTKAPIAIINAPPQLAVEVPSTVAPAEASTAAAMVVIIDAPPSYTTTTVKQPVTVENVTEPQPLQTPPTDAAPAVVEATPKQETPLQVTGFITQNGNIYEVLDKNGIGRIEGRQNSDSDTTAPFVCNYGAVVIYSDVPCNEVTNVRVGGVHREVPSTVEHKEQEPAESQQSTAVVQQAVAENTSTDSNNNNADTSSSSSNVETSEKAQLEHMPNDDDDSVDFDEMVPVAVKRRRANKKPANQRKRNGIRQRPNAVRRGDGGNRRRQQAKRQPSQQQQKRRRQQNNRYKNQQQRRRLQNQKQQQQKRRRYQSGNRNTKRRQQQRLGNNKNTRFYLEYDYDY